MTQASGKMRNFINRWTIRPDGVNEQEQMDCNNRPEVETMCEFRHKIEPCNTELSRPSKGKVNLLQADNFTIDASELCLQFIPDYRSAEKQPCHFPEKTSNFSAVLNVSLCRIVDG